MDLDRALLDCVLAGVETGIFPLDNERDMAALLDALAALVDAPIARTFALEIRKNMHDGAGSWGGETAKTRIQ